MKKKSKLFYRIFGCFLILFLVLNLVACELDTIYCKVEMNKTVFNIETEEIVMDFYFGWLKYNENDSFSDVRYYNGEEFETYCYALYFYGYSSTFGNSETLYDDYRNIDGQYLIKEISIEDFTSDSYAYKRKPAFFWAFDKYEYSHHELFAIPKEILKPREYIGNGGTIGFAVMRIVRHIESGLYAVDLINHGGLLSVYYKYLTDNTIRFSK